MKNKHVKLVNIYPSMPIITINPPIRTVVKRVYKSVEEIRACLMARATVEEILSNGDVVNLNIGNYDNYFELKADGCKYEDEDKTEKVDVEQKTPWQIAYDNAIGDKDLESLTRKQRRSLEAAARAAADAATTKNENNVDENVVVEEKNNVVNEDVIVETNDIETSIV